jgi:hypothetical protein
MSHSFSAGPVEIKPALGLGGDDHEQAHEGLDIHSVSEPEEERDPEYGVEGIAEKQECPRAAKTSRPTPKSDCTIESRYMTSAVVTMAERRAGNVVSCSSAALR